MFVPKKTKYKKAQKGHPPKGISIRCNTISYGKYGLKSLTPGKITSKQIEAVRRTIMRKTKKLGKLWIRVYPDIPISLKPAEVRMGKGKGNPEYYISKVKAGRVLFELDNLTYAQAKEVLENVKYKLPILTKFVHKID
uniref:Ribosomal protein L16 n=1 Tax=Malawimonas californiana TaxID=221722 RepID=A0A0B5GCR0_MALCL|nr:ribosomal protein L16 [Malawimonas californiana]AJF22876.1 ribosomal protein L16 [Malawimonas californiana]